MRSSRTESSSDVRLRAARSDEAELLSSIAQEAKASWGYPPHWLRQWQDALTITPAFIATGLTMVATVDDEVAGFYGLEWRNSILWLEHLWIRPAWMSQGIGSILMKAAIQHSRNLASPKLYTESDPHAEGFYLRMGASRIDELHSQIQGHARVVPILEFGLSPPS